MAFRSAFLPRVPPGRRFASAWSLLYPAPSNQKNIFIKADIEPQVRLSSDRVERDLRRRAMLSQVNMERLQLAKAYFEYAWKMRDSAKSKYDRAKLENLQKMENVVELQKEIQENLPIIKDMDRQLDELEGEICLDFLALPCPLHANVPDESEVCWLSPDAPDREVGLVSHIPVGDPLGFVEGRQAVLELDLWKQWREFHNNNSNSLERATLHSAPDFVRSVILAGCGVDWQSTVAEIAIDASHGNHTFKDIETGAGLHLVGGASLYAAVGYLCKNVVTRPSVLPHAFIQHGRRYQPSHNDPEKIRQSSSVYYFAFGRKACTEDRFNRAVNLLLKEFYLDFDVPFRLIEVGAPDLARCEGRKVIVQLFDATTGAYESVAHLALYDDYISSRLMLKEMEFNEPMRNLYCYGGTVMDKTILARILSRKK